MLNDQVETYRKLAKIAAKEDQEGAQYIMLLPGLHFWKVLQIGGYNDVCLLVATSNYLIAECALSRILAKFVVVGLRRFKTDVLSWQTYAAHGANLWPKEGDHKLSVKFQENVPWNILKPWERYVLRTVWIPRLSPPETFEHQGHL